MLRKVKPLKQPFLTFFSRLIATTSLNFHNLLIMNCFDKLPFTLITIYEKILNSSGGKYSICTYVRERKCLMFPICFEALFGSRGSNRDDWSLRRNSFGLQKNFIVIWNFKIYHFKKKATTSVAPNIIPFTNKKVFHTGTWFWSVSLNGSYVIVIRSDQYIQRL